MCMGSLVKTVLDSVREHSNLNRTVPTFTIRIKRRDYWCIDELCVLLCASKEHTTLFECYKRSTINHYRVAGKVLPTANIFVKYFTRVSK